MKKDLVTFIEIMRYHFISPRVANIKKIMPDLGEHMEQMEYSHSSNGIDNEIVMF